MGFSIGRFLGSIVGPVVGAVIPGPVGSALGGALTASFARPPGRTTPAAPASAVNVFTQAPPLTSTVPTPNRLSFAGLPGTTSLFGSGGVGRALGRTGTALTLFGGNGNGKRGRLQLILQEARENTGGPVTRNAIIEAAKVCGLETAAATFGISMEDVCFVVVRGRTRRRRGISAADIRRTKRTIRFVKGLQKDLGAVKARRKAS